MNSNDKSCRFIGSKLLTIYYNIDKIEMDDLRRIE